MFSILTFILFAFVFLEIAIGNDIDGLEMIDVQVLDKNGTDINDRLSDVLIRSKGRFSLEHGRSTQAHETVHMINSSLRGVLLGEGRRNVNAFYCGKGEAIVLSNPKVRIRSVSNFVPRNLRGDRYKLYFVDQLQYWDDVPTYIIDEWSAYVTGAEVGVEDFLDSKFPKENTDVVCGALEFSIYSVGLCLATRKLDPEYWEKDHRLKHTVKYFLIRSEKVFYRGREHFVSKKQEALLDTLRRDKDCEEIRDFIKDNFDGIFLEN